jgi:hypothetical protein
VLWIHDILVPTDPTKAPDPAFFVSGWQDAINTLVFYQSTFTSIITDKSSKRSRKIVEIKVLLFCFFAGWRKNIRIQWIRIRIHKHRISNYGQYTVPELNVNGSEVTQMNKLWVGKIVNVRCPIPWYKIPTHTVTPVLFTQGPVLPVLVIKFNTSYRTQVMLSTFLFHFIYNPAYLWINVLFKDSRKLDAVLERTGTRRQWTRRTLNKKIIHKDDVSCLCCAL